MAEFLDLLASHYAGSQLETTKAGRVLHLPGQGRVILLSGESCGSLDSQDSVIWSLRRQSGAQSPCFAFEELTVFGPWTPFAETVANYLSTECGTHFAVEPTDPKD